MTQVSGSIVIQNSLAPVYVVTFTGKVSDQEFRAHLAALSAIIERPGSRALVYDARLAQPAPASQRQLQAEWMKGNDAAIRRATAGIAFVVPSAIVRGALTAILWLQPLACPHRVTANFEDGFRWARQQLAAAKPVGRALSR